MNWTLLILFIFTFSAGFVIGLYCNAPDWTHIEIIKLPKKFEVNFWWLVFYAFICELIGEFIGKTFL